MATENILKHAVENDFNVLLSGKHGVGKTALVKQCFEDAGLNWKYFSASTIDPWTDLVGVPKEKDGILEFILPSDLDHDNIEAMFLDEYNRAPKKVRNAVMELVQFGSINGKKFPKLKVVWVAINPDDDDDFNYDVEKLDGAQIDRFHIKVDIKYEPSLAFFKGKYGSTGVSVVKWWKDLKKEQQLLCSPRRLEYALEVVTAGGDARYVLDKACGIPEFISVVKLGDPIETLDKLMNKTDAEIRKFLANNNDFKRIKADLVGKNRYLDKMAHLIPEEELIKALRPKSRGNALITYVVKHPEKFGTLGDAVILNPTSYSGRVLDSFKKFKEGNGQVAPTARATRSEVEIKGKKTTLRNMHVCFTGSLDNFDRKTATTLLESHGINVCRTVDAYTTHLFTGEKPGSKLAKAERNSNITILYQNDWDQFVTDLQVPAASSSVIINDVKLDINSITLENYNTLTGQRFRLTKDQAKRLQQGILSRPEALKESLDALLRQQQTICTF